METDHYRWREDYETGDATIDAQHRELIKLSNLLMDAAGKGRTRDILKDAFKALFRYTQKHFREEEAFWEKSGLPTLDEHRRMHRELVAELEKLWSDETLDFVETSGGELTAWVTNRLIIHMKRADRKAVQEVSGSRKK
jgi:hemerythrin-like metal-binding protein